MLRNYLLTAWRNLIQQRIYSLINLLGLALGITSCLLISLYVQHELAYDDYHEKADRIYRISSEMQMGGNLDHYAMSGMAVGPEVTNQYPEVDTFTRFMYTSNARTVKYGEKIFKEEAIFLADPQVFEVFSYQLLEGDPRRALERPSSVVLTQSLARKYFVDESPMGKRLRIGQTDFEVTGVMADLPDNTDFRFQALLSMSTLPEAILPTFMQDWGRVTFYTYLLFERADGVKGFDEKLRSFVDERVIPFWQENGVTGSMTYHLTALRDLHFVKGISYDTPKGNKSYLYIFSLVAVFILLIACFNYINLAIAQSARRSIEVGVRKATGASSRQLIGQFLGESILLSLLAMAVSLVLVEISLPFFNELAGKNFESGLVFRSDILLLTIAISLFAGLAAGSYPALFLGRLKPIQVLKGQLSLGGRHWLRKTLVVIQFSISIGLIIATLVVREQMNYMQNRDLGFRQDQMMVVEVAFDSLSQAVLPGIQQELLNNPAVKTVAASRNGLPGQNTSALLMRVEQDGQLREDQFNVIWVDDNYFDVLGLEVMKGRTFDRDRGTDPQQAFMVNEAFVKQLGWDEPLGKRMQWGLMADNQAANDGQVVGVVKDWHHTSLHNPIEPLVLLYAPAGLNRLIVQLDGRKVSQGLEHVQTVWESRLASQPFDYFFLDQFFSLQYDQETRLMTLFSAFSGLTILIACLGLFGLASFIARQRTKEIGIRKVLGADRAQILLIMVRDFLILVLIAVIFASAIAWCAMSEWLEGFAFATDMPWYAFVIAGLSAFLMALIATSYQSLRVSKANPVEALRYE